MKFTLENYELPDGTEPVTEFLDSLDDNMADKIFYEMGLLEKYGNTLREPHTKHLEDGIFELRAKFSSNISRVFFFFYYKGVIVLTHGIIKKTQKTPRSEIIKAKKYREDYITRHGGK